MLAQNSRFLSLQRKSTKILPNRHASRAVEGADRRADADDEKNSLRPSLGPITQAKRLPMGSVQERFGASVGGQKRRWDGKSLLMKKF